LSGDPGELDASHEGQHAFDSVGLAHDRFGVSLIEGSLKVSDHLGAMAEEGASRAAKVFSLFFVEFAQGRLEFVGVRGVRGFADQLIDFSN
jgi:hypothetical protein